MIHVIYKQARRSQTASIVMVCKDEETAHNELNLLVERYKQEPGSTTDGLWCGSNRIALRQFNKQKTRVLKEVVFTDVPFNTNYNPLLMVGGIRI